MNTSIVRLGVVLLIAGLFLGAVSGATAAPPPPDNQPVNLELTDVDAQAAIRMLFQSTGRNYSISPDVTGTIPSVSFKDVAFDQALKTLLKSAGLVYRIDGDSNIYIISKKTAVVNPNPTPQTADLAPVETTAAEETTIEKVKLNNVGASEILSMMGAGGSTSGTQGFGNYGTFGNSGSSMGGGSSFGGGGSSFGGGSSMGGGGGNYGGGGGNYGGGGGNYGGGGGNYGGGSRGW